MEFKRKITQDQMVQQVNEIVRNWSNLRTTTFDGWTALHLACKQSNSIFMYLVEELGADVLIKNEKDIGIHHKAAYDDNNFVLTYLVEKAALNIDELDQKGNTPLHYACDHKAEYSPQWLFAFGAEINALNEDGNTPLHLLVKNPHKLDSPKLVREMIFKGADRDIRNKDGKTPMQILQEECHNQELNGDIPMGQSLRQELEAMLGKQPVYIPCINLKQPMQKLENSRSMVIFYTILMVVTFAYLWQFVLPFIHFHFHGIPLVSLFLLQFLMYFITVCMDPGLVSQSQRISFLKLNQYFKPRFLCPTCRIVKPRDSLHCYFCNKCVNRQDHHCPWINQCVGIKNHNFFLSFLVLLWLYLLLLMITCGLHIIQPTELLVPHPTFPRSFVSPLQLEPNHNMFMIVLVILIIISLFFFGPLSFLLLIQCLNYMNAKTTADRFKGSKVQQEVNGAEYAREILMNPEDFPILINQSVNLSKEVTQISSLGQSLSVPGQHLENWQRNAQADGYSPNIHRVQSDVYQSDSRHGDQEISSLAVSEIDDTIGKDAKFGRQHQNSTFQAQQTPRFDSRKKQQRYCSCGTLKNCIKFWNAKSLEQEEMMQNEMLLDTEYLLLTPTLQNHQI